MDWQRYEMAGDAAALAREQGEREHWRWGGYALVGMDDGRWELWRGARLVTTLAGVPDGEHASARARVEADAFVREHANANPEAGMGATEFVGADRYPYEVLEVRDGPTRVVLRAMRREGGRNVPDATGRTVTASLRASGHWVEVGLAIRNGRRFRIGVADAYRDPHV